MSIKREQFAVGQKVKIVEGGWGVHPHHIGQIVTIRQVFWDSTSYSLEEDLGKGTQSNQHGPTMRADGRSFEAIVGVATTELIREVNARIKAKDVEFEALIAQKDALKSERQRLIATLLKELEA